MTILPYESLRYSGLGYALLDIQLGLSGIAIVSLMRKLYFSVSIFTTFEKTIDTDITA
ncbi:hypothetical protein GPN62_004743 [Salmonella enterica]|nr:hypothetical protein [Salmonella enterica subsp. houtenae serovar 50:z4,z23:-]EDQ4997777.1 hypothetical protein [Salmonella enterica]HAE7874419.1 hypothetical protein [Salmonella enterica subsp. enterica serovar 1,9,12:-:-]EDR1883340.1 hypothetical protein [Salmonella enterica]EDR3948447.1 hypothetical protein [Salmonella enterica]